jgi:MmyB-like transcription regulator ligand binding domain
VAPRVLRELVVSGSAPCGPPTMCAPTARAPNASHHPDVGELVLAYEELAVTAEPGLILMIYTPEPGSPSAERLRLLASASPR